MVRRSGPRRSEENSLHDGAWNFATSASVVVPFPVPETDFGLVDALRVKHPSALRVLCDRHSGELLKVATRLLGCETQIVPLVIRTLKRAMEDLDDLVEPRALRLWLLMRLVDSVRWHLRWRSVRRRLWPKSRIQTSETRLYQWRSAATYQLLDELPVEPRLAFCLVFISAMKPPEAAHVLGTTVAKMELCLREAQLKIGRYTSSFDPELRAVLPASGSIDRSIGRSIAQEQDRFPHVEQLYEFDLTRRRRKGLGPVQVLADHAVVRRLFVPLLLILSVIIGVVIGHGRPPTP